MLSWKQMPAPRVELRAVSKTYQNGGQPTPILHRIDLKLMPATLTALVGRSGCAKTTLLNLAGAAGRSAGTSARATCQGVP